MKIKDKVIVIVGPTSSGKSDWAVNLAQKLNGEVISADARQVYRDLNIGTGKITEREKRGVNHHLLDVASPHRKFSASDFKHLGEKAITKIRKNNRWPIIAGGTGFYIDVLLGRIPLPAIKPNAKLRQSLEKLKTEELYNRLNKLDPHRAKTIDRHNRPRLIRAIEIAKELGQVPIIKIKKTDDQKVLWLGIKTNHQELKEKIKSRLKKRLSQGLIAEVKNLRRPPTGRGLSNKRFWSLGLEYRYVNLYLEGQLSKTEMLDKLEQEIIKYAKRQLTWFKTNQQINWIENYQSAEKLVKQFLEN